MSELQVFNSTKFGSVKEIEKVNKNDYIGYLYSEGVQYKQGDIWLLYQKHAEQGYTSTKMCPYNGNDGTQHTRPHTYWTQKGRLFIYDLMKTDGILPMIEMEVMQYGS